MTIIYEEWQRDISYEAAAEIAKALEPVASAGMMFLGQLLDAAKATGKTDWSTLCASLDGDGGVMLEWIWPRHRIVLTICQDEDESGWCFIDGRCEPMRVDHGPTETFDAAKVVGRAIG